MVFIRQSASGIPDLWELIKSFAWYFKCSRLGRDGSDVYGIRTSFVTPGVRKFRLKVSSRTYGFTEGGLLTFPRTGCVLYATLKYDCRGTQTQGKNP